MECEYKGRKTDPCDGEVEMRKAMTAYVYDAVDKASGKPDPNRDFAACAHHYECYHEYWTQMWNEYYHSQG